ncbi:hypothetical protein LMED105_06612 [Limnobacter sp. MED105]|jgi:hypothetical protein|nr:hypothetical protein LMED105_06612 [Limnobacter sp. MED105]
MVMAPRWREDTETDLENCVDMTMLQWRTSLILHEKPSI